MNLEKNTNLKNIIKDVYQDVEQEEKIIDEFVTYSINENIFHPGTFLVLFFL